MYSKILGSIEFNEERLNSEIDQINKFRFSSAYKNYSVGEWKTCLLWNKTGRSNDGISVEYSGSAQPTEFGEKLEYINSTINGIFNMKTCKSVRIFAARGNSLIIPHRDYLEFKDGFHRIHIPLQTDSHSFMSERDSVFAIRQGEIWFIDGNQVHSGGSFSNKLRLNLVFDFSTETSIVDIFKDQKIYNENLEIKLVQRPELSDEKLSSILNLSFIIDHNNIRDIIAILAKIHFFFNVSSELMYDWLIEICNRSNNQKLIKAALRFKEYFLIKGPTIPFPLDEY